MEVRGVKGEREQDKVYLPFEPLIGPGGEAGWVMKKKASDGEKNQQTGSNPAAEIKKKKMQ